MTDESTQEKLLIEEYKSCRELIAKNIDIIERTEVYAVAAAAALFVFSLSATNKTIAVVSAWMPLVVAILGLMRFRGIDDTIDKINSYFIKLEGRYATIGWTTFYREKNKKKELKRTRYGIWFDMIAVSIVFGTYMSCTAPISNGSDKPIAVNSGSR